MSGKLTAEVWGLTVVWREQHTPWPLIHFVEVLKLDHYERKGIDRAWDHEDEIKRLVVEQRVLELADESLRDDLNDDVELLFAFEGDLKLTLDWRC